MDCMVLIYSNIMQPMKASLLNCLPPVHWTPHDIPQEESAQSSHTHPLWFTRRKQVVTTKNDLAKEQNGRFPVHRRKSIISLTNMSDEELDKKTHAQGQSVFFKLPAEIRQLVYEHLVGEKTIHLTFGARRKFGHFLCEDQELDSTERLVKDCACKVLVGGRESRKLEASILGFMQICRRVYTEAIPQLYKPHTFALLHITHLLYLPTRLPSPRMNNIRTLRIRWAIRALPYLRRATSRERYAYPEDTANWIQGWNTLANMQGLRDLYVVLSDPSRRGHSWESSWLELEDCLLESVKKVKQTRRFELVLPYESCRIERDMGDCAVILRRPEIGGEEAEDA